MEAAARLTATPARRAISRPVQRLIELVRAEAGSPTARERRRLGLFAAGLVLLCLAGYVVVEGLNGGYRSSDWPNAMILTRLLWTDPSHVYDHVSQLQTQASILGPGGFTGQPGGILRLSSPPWLGLLSSAVAWAGVNAGGILWCLLQLACLVCGLLLVAKNRTDALLAAASIPAWVMVANANAVGLVVLGLGLCWRLREKHPWLAGLALGLALVRPNVLIPLPVAFILTRQWKVLGGSVLALAGLVGMAELVHPGLTWSWATTVIAQAGHIGPDVTPAGIGWALGSHLGWAFTAAGLGVGLYLTRGRGPGLFPAALLASPHALVQSLVLVSAGLAAGRRCGLRELGLLNASAVVLILFSSNHLLVAIAGTALLIAVTALLSPPRLLQLRSRSVDGEVTALELAGASAAA